MFSRKANIRIVLKTFFLLCSPLLLLGQSIKGHLVDELKNSVVGAYVIHLQSEQHAHTNEFGKFFINDVKLGDTLKIVHLGYETILFPVQKISEELVIELTEASFELGEVIVGQNIKKTNIISAIDIQTNPVNSAQEVLRKVPGLFIGQHAGGGKAEQIFLRGFDIDHGTDVHLSVDGIPVNMVSHAHGQGYADLHFLIPETIEKIDFGKGPYYGEKGNFGTAGYVQFNTKDRLQNSQLSFETGRFNTFRTVGLFNVLDTEDHHFYLAGEYMISDGAFESSQNFGRNNFMAKYTGQLTAQDRISVMGSHFFSKWEASGQIPQRAVDAGLVTRFGAIDDTEGGNTSRSNLAFDFNHALSDHAFVKNTLFYSKYDFELFSNFTFFLNDPINGDQIRQKEERQLFGFESVWNHVYYLENTTNLLQLGAGLRNDQISNNELSRTLNRKTTLNRIQYGDVDEKNIYAFANVEFDFGNWLIQPAVRVDYFRFNYVNKLDTIFNNQSQSKAAFSPKLNIIRNFNEKLQVFLKSGIGFHSNDSRVVLSQNDKSILPAAYGTDLGAIFKPTRRMVANFALWYLFLEQEFVYVGDEGVVEPSGKSKRAGFDLGLRYQLKDGIFATADFNYSFARSIGNSNDNNRIPLAPVFTATGGLTYKKKDLSAGFNFRYLQDRPANEDNSIIAEGYFIADVNLNYNFKSISFGLSIENLFNQEWKETQFATTSRMKLEEQPIEEIHFTPGTPFYIKGIAKYKF